jgi:gamma-glutamyltranspeptidase/glutathione hydrolase
MGGGAAVFLPNGRLPSAGEQLVQLELATTIEQIACGGRGVMYDGALGERILEYLRRRGGGLQAEDFVAQRSEWVQPLVVDYQGVDVCELPPNTQGIALLQMLNMLFGTDLPMWGARSAELVHQLVERKKLAFADRDSWVADPACAFIPVDRLLDRQYAMERARGIAREASQAQAMTVGRSVDGDTVYLCAADREGTMVSLIQSLYAAFGSGVHVPGTGVTLHNRGFGFNLLAGHPNALAPGKRPMHTLMPGFALRNGQPWLAFGTRGADGQPQTGLQVLNSLLDFGLGLQAAVEAPRWAHGAPGGRYAPTALVIERRFGQSVAEDLARRGHEVMVADSVDPVMGTVQAIQVDDERGCLIAATDPRGDGVALGL